MQTLDVATYEADHVARWLAPWNQSDQAVIINSVTVEYLTNQVSILSKVMLLSYAAMCVLSGLLIIYIRYHRTEALKGDTEAARKILLPSFEPLLWILCIGTGAYSMYFIYAWINNVFLTRIASLPTECFYAGRQFVQLLVIIFMLQKSVSIPSLVRATTITFFLSSYSVPVVWYTSTHDEIGNANTYYWLLTTIHGLVFLVYAYILIRPPGRASKRTLREYCAFAFIYNSFEVAYPAAFHENKVKLGFDLIYPLLIWGSFAPFFIWRVLKADTEHWRGMGQRACALQCLFRQRTNVNERISSEGLHLLIEMHRKFIIDFAYLKLNERIGIGSSAVVYKGILHSKTQVAIKVYTPTSVTEDTVAAFSHEAALCGALHHPNIVKFYGMCVCPPTICLVSEFCHASLDTVIDVVAHRPHQPSREQLLINIGYMIDAARAVAYLHSFTPAFVHRDIKPGNFLVDFDGNVKLTDFGESRALPKANIEWEKATSTTTSQTNTSNNNTEKRTPGSNRSMDDSYTELNYHEINFAPDVFDSHSSLATFSSNSHNHHRHHTVKMTVTGTVDYMAPEMIQGKAGMASYGEAADIYSLAITMWDILHPGSEKYPESHNNHLRVFESVMAGDRPDLDPELHPALREIITRAWHVDARIRPTAEMIVHTLESIQAELCASFALHLVKDLDHEMMLHKSGGNHMASIVKSFTGKQAVYRMQAREAVASSDEAVRLGNMLMDARFMHHLKHTQSFERSDDILYFFDIERINLLQPFAIPSSAESSMVEPIEGATGSTTVPAGANADMLTSMMWNQYRLRPRYSSDSTVTATSGSSHNDISSLLDPAPIMGCACQRLGQRLDDRKPSRRKLQYKQKTIPEENILTINLLQEEDDNSVDRLDIRYDSGGH